MENQATAEGCDNLGDADGAVEQTQVGADMVTGECIGQYCERHGEHGGPGASHQRVAYGEHIGMVDEVNRHEADGTDKQRQGVADLAVLELGENDSPKHGGDGLDGEKNAVPVTGILIFLGGCVEHGGVVDGYVLGGGSLIEEKDNGESSKTKKDTKARKRGGENDEDERPAEQAKKQAKQVKQQPAVKQQKQQTEKNEAQAADKTAQKPAQKPTSKTEAKPEAKPEPKPQAKPEPKPATKPETAPEPKLEADSSSKPELLLPAHVEPAQPESSPSADENPSSATQETPGANPEAEAKAKARRRRRRRPRPKSDSQPQSEE